MFNWTSQIVLITGGTGSFGQHFTRTLLKKYHPRQIRIYSRDEYKQYVMQQELNHRSLRYFIGDVRDAERLSRAVDGTTMVVHAAAMKQIVASEYNPTEAVKTNVLGTMNVINCALNHGVERVLGLITDKAVSPVNLYGATKLCMEKVMIQSNSYVGRGKTKISCVRYGNVAGSRGSVIPLFLKQKNAGTLTVTHPEMTRFWITLDEGVGLVLKALGLMEGGEVFIPKMPSFRVMDLAQAIAPQAKVKYTQIRPGEKLHEDLITIHESRDITEYKDYYVLRASQNFWGKHKKNSGRQAKPGFYYNSGSNRVFLTVKELKFRISSLMV